jgi:transposase-like protein
MILYHDFGLTPEEYQKCDLKKILPVFDVCPHCHAHLQLYRHGFRNRYALVLGIVFLLVVCRFRCRCCKKSFTLLPSFLLPQFQNTASSIISFLHSGWKIGKDSIYRQLSYFYRKRFLQNLPLLQGFMIGLGNRDPVPSDKKEKAITILEWMLSVGCEALVQKFFAQFHQSFMAKMQFDCTT